MKKRSLPAMIAAALILGVSVPFIFCASAQAADVVTTQELIDNMAQYDGQEVTIAGEAIGDLMQRGDYGWITVNDDPYSAKSVEEGGSLEGISNVGIGVWAPMNELEDVHILGGYKNKGDLVRVTGTFNRICHEHGGDTDIHASSVVVLEQGYPFSHHFQYWMLFLILGLAAIIAVLWNLRGQRIRRALRRA